VDAFRCLDHEAYRSVLFARMLELAVVHGVLKWCQKRKGLSQLISLVLQRTALLDTAHLAEPSLQKISKFAVSNLTRAGDLKACRVSCASSKETHHHSQAQLQATECRLDRLRDLTGGGALRETPNHFIAFRAKSVPSRLHTAGSLHYNQRMLIEEPGPRRSYQP
jgi:hypothetical protein